MAILMGCLGAGVTLAQPTVTAAAPPKGWETTAAAAITLTRGNSDTFLGTLSIDTVRKWEKDEAMLGASGAYGENDSVANQESIQGYGQYNRLLSEKLYMGFRLDAQYDGIAGVDYRVRITPMIGYYLIKTPKTLLALEAGPSAVFEQLKGRDAETFPGGAVWRTVRAQADRHHQNLAELRVCSPRGRLGRKLFGQHGSGHRYGHQQALESARGVPGLLQQRTGDRPQGKRPAPDGGHRL